MYNTHTKSTQNNENIQYTYKKSQKKNIQYSYKNRQNKENVQHSYKNGLNKLKKKEYNIYTTLGKLVYM